MKTGIFGGTFNPIHYGHLRAAEEVREKAALDRILFIPSGKPPLKTRDIADARHRYEMVRLAIAGNPFFTLSDIECRLTGKSYTVRTLETVSRESPANELFLILGIDAFLDIPNWWQPERLVSMTNFIIISRPGYAFQDLRDSPYITIPRRVLKGLDSHESEQHSIQSASGRDITLISLIPIGISSTGIRKLIRQGMSIKYLLPAEIQSYIIMNKLYRNQKLKVKR